MNENSVVKEISLDRPVEEIAEARTSSYVTEHLVRAVHDLTQAAYRWDETACEQAAEDVLTLIMLHRAVVSYSANVRPIPLYLVSAWFLLRIFRLLSRKRHETIVYVTGPEGDGNLFVLSRLLPLKLAQHSAAHARADLKHQITVLTQMEEAGYRLFACLHSHPGTGPAATVPSPTDLRTQANFEQGGYATIGGIFSRDGHVRFFSHNRPFRVRVTGNGATQVGDNLFRLEQVSQWRRAR